MDDTDKQNLRILQDRIAVLEKAVGEMNLYMQRLHYRLEHFIGSQQYPPKGTQPSQQRPPRPTLAQAETTRRADIPVGRPVAPMPRPPQPPASKSFVLPENMRKSEYWLNKIGIALILFAVVFLFKYSIDKGWLTPPIRIIFGVVLGSALLVLGSRLYGKKRHFSQVLTGGAIATYYITGYAAFQLFQLISYPVALIFMTAVTVLGFIISIKQDNAVFSLIATIGGLGTPFLLYTDTGSITGLMIYTCLILAGASAVYYFRGWRSLLWLSIIGGWLVVMIGLFDTVDNGGTIESSDQWALQGGILATWLFFWAIPLLRKIVGTLHPERLRTLSIGFGDNVISPKDEKILDLDIYLLTVLVPFITLVLSFIAWPDLSRHEQGWISLGVAVVYGLVSLYINRQEVLKKLAFTHAVVGLMFVTLAISLFFKGDTLFFALVSEAVVLHVISLRLSAQGFAITAHVLFALCALIIFNRLGLQIPYLSSPSIERTPIINARAFADLWFIGWCFYLGTRFAKEAIRRTYLIVAFVFLGTWLCRELQGNIEFVAVLAEAVAIFFIARIKRDLALTITGHVFFGILAIWLIYRLATPLNDVTAIINSRALVTLIGIIVFSGVYRLLNSNIERIIYPIFAHIALMGWFLSEFISLENGQGFVTIAWGVDGALLLIAGLRYHLGPFRTVSILTLFTVVAKLFLVDLANLEVLWRILLFMGFGGLFLFLSYYFQDLWRAKEGKYNQIESSSENKGDNQI